MRQRRSICIKGDQSVLILLYGVATILIIYP